MKGISQFQHPASCHWGQHFLGTGSMTAGRWAKVPAGGDSSASQMQMAADRPMEHVLAGKATYPCLISVVFACVSCRVSNVLCAIAGTDSASCSGLSSDSFRQVLGCGLVRSGWQALLEDADLLSCYKATVAVPSERVTMYSRPDFSQFHTDKRLAERDALEQVHSAIAGILPS